MFFVHHEHQNACTHALMPPACNHYCKHLQIKFVITEISLESEITENEHDCVLLLMFRLSLKCVCVCVLICGFASICVWVWGAECFSGNFQESPFLSLALQAMDFILGGSPYVCAHMIYTNMFTDSSPLIPVHSLQFTNSFPHSFQFTHFSLLIPLC